MTSLGLDAVLLPAIKYLLFARVCMQNNASISPLMIGLLVVVVLLASSTLYMAFLVFQPNYKAAAQTTNVSSSQSNITVSGVGQVSYTPNEALVQVNVQTQNSSAAAATAQNAQTTSSVIKALNGIGISNSSIQTQGYSLSTDYSNCYSGPCTPQITGYVVSNSLQVNITSNDPAQLGVSAGKAIDTAVGSGANGISLYFSTTKSIMYQLTTQALQDAVYSASSQAHTIASSMGVSIVSVISASDMSSYAQPYYGDQVYAAAITNASNVPTPIMPGTQTISETVQVVYSIT